MTTISTTTKFLFTLSYCLLITGCAVFQATPPASEKAIPWETRKTQLTTIKNWNVKGSVSVQYQQKTDIASLAWHQQNQNYQITLSGPLNFGSIDIVGSPNLVTLSQSNRPPASAHTAESLMAQQLGWQIPVSNLYYWIRAIPAPGSNAQTQIDSFGHITQMQQQGWTITYSEYMGVGSVDLPKKIYLSNPSLKIRLVIRQWNI